MKKSHILLPLLLVFSTLNIFAGENSSPWHFEFTPQAGIKAGTLNEYWYSSIFTGERVSYLNWNVQNLFDLGLEAKAQYKKAGLSAGFNCSLPLKCGQMNDSDYNFYINSVYCYSENELHSNFTFDAHLDFFYDLTVTKEFTVSPKISAFYTRNSFTAKNGEGWYGTETQSHGPVAWNDPEATHYPKGSLCNVNYKSHNFYTFIGLEARTVYKKLTASFIFMISPYTLFYAVDNHQGTTSNPGYYVKCVKQSYFTQYQAASFLDFELTPKYSVTAAINFTFGQELTAPMRYSQNGKTYTRLDQEIGSEVKTCSVKTGLKIKF